MNAVAEKQPVRRIVAYDALRVFAIVAVVGIHTLMPYRHLASATSPVRLFDELLHFAVPLFVFISGLFIWSRPMRAGEFGSFLFRRASVIAVPFVAWSAIYMAVLYGRGTPPDSLGRAFGLLLTGHTWYHLYFIPMLLTFYLLTPVASRIALFSPELLVVACYALRIAAGPAIMSAARALGGDLSWAFAAHVIGHLPHMALGAWFALRRPRIASWWIALLLLAFGTAGVLAASYGLTAQLPELLRRLVEPAYMAATVLGLVAAALCIEPTLERFEPVILRGAGLSFGVYFVHPLFLTAVKQALKANAAESLWLQTWFPLAVFVGATVGSFAVSALLAKWPVSCRLVGLAKPLPPAPVTEATYASAARESESGAQ
ncbi:MAG TPA: acyltransferase [Coriobacteriia bacterium]|nr:acyltransferase [Coriobacteriia bacterium]